MKYKILYYSDYYDGPISGLVVYEGKERWFRMFAYGGWAVSDFYTDSEYEEYQECWIPRVYQVVNTPFWFIYKQKIIHWLFLRLAKNKHYKPLASKFFYKFINPQWVVKLNREFISKQKTIGVFSDMEYKE